LGSVIVAHSLQNLSDESIGPPHVLHDEVNSGFLSVEAGGRAVVDVLRGLVSILEESTMPHCSLSISRILSKSTPNSPYSRFSLRALLIAFNLF